MGALFFSFSLLHIDFSIHQGPSVDTTEPLGKAKTSDRGRGGAVNPAKNSFPIQSGFVMPRMVSSCHRNAGICGFDEFEIYSFRNKNKENNNG